MRFNMHEEKIMSRLNTLKELLVEVQFYGEPCPLLESQLNEALVIGEKFLTEISNMEEQLQKRKE